MDMRKTVLLTGLAAALFFIPGVPGLVDAQPRWVLVNGIPQNPIQLSTLDRYACTVIPNGSYWLDYNTGIWGYAGNPRPMGRIGDEVQPIVEFRPPQSVGARNALQLAAVGPGSLAEVIV